MNQQLSNQKKLKHQKQKNQNQKKLKHLKLKKKSRKINLKTK